jgi:putative endonuclease
MFYYLYILQSLKDKKFYTGITSDLKRRFQEHNSGKNISTSYRRPFKLIYYEAYLLKKDVEAREKYLKTSMGKRVIKKQLSNFLKLTFPNSNSPK